MKNIYNLLWHITVNENKRLTLGLVKNSILMRMYYCNAETIIYCVVELAMLIA